MTLACLVSSAGLFVGCSQSSDDSAAVLDTADTEDQRVVSYTVRGEVRALPDTSTDLMVHHEAIPEFRQGNGTLGMNVMVMPFPFDEDEGLNAEELSVGDKIAITFEVTHRDDWSLVGYQTTGWEVLSPDTELNFMPIDAGTKQFDTETGGMPDGPADYVEPESSKDNADE